MLVPPKSLLHLGAGLLTARTARRLRQRATDVPAQHAALRWLLTALSSTALGREHGLHASQSYDDFRRRVPIRSYEQFAPFIERMKKGEADVLWPGPCRLYAVTSGTTAGQPKHLPVTPAMLEHFRKAGLDSLFYYTARTGHSRIFRGRHLLLGGSSALTALEASKDTTAYAGDLSGIATLNLPRWAEAHLYEPGGEIAQMSDSPEKIQAIAARTRSLDIRVVAGIPNWLLLFAEELCTQGRRERAPHVQAVWPEFECVVHGGVPLGPFADELRQAMGPRVRFHEVYSAAEGFIAAQDTDTGAGLRLMTNAGLFYEFLPMEGFDEKRLESLGPTAVPLEGVRVGVDYALLLTTPAGLTRYLIGDVVRFTSKDPARLLYVGRTRLHLNAFGERVVEKELTDALLEVCRRHGWTITNFHVAPLFANSVTGQNRGRHEWWVELKPFTTETPTGPNMAVELDGELQRVNRAYAEKRKGGGLEAPFVRLVMPGVFAQWMQENGKPGGQNKMPRCRGDRQIADALAKIARFSAD